MIEESVELSEAKIEANFPGRPLLQTERGSELEWQAERGELSRRRADGEEMTPARYNFDRR